ncbi:2-hydroxychromene-2-carboxylate isomerase [Paracoccus seriniphilus]|uniref:2-hydroxychromene-2-carboxylate isomerase n=1 Tax=Paracoccus seriniphilus TaxID=184748 RepID=A0A239Q1L5_9RHOB|nr:2-hydroxychromene-2-carboxylate isomerase [Paracoccus seriniphilus]WCR13276.1 2-hydroxychromene-2-carboxylate isomerase [Paracoccus seriniphilus]SNT76479.1 2-hydroxychromene-2-carboxylate isomerase [Paracoccus seriniphilus]
MANIDYYLGTISPYCYLAANRLEEIAEKHGATINYKPVDLLQLFSRTGGVKPADRHPSRMEYRAQELTRWADHLNMPFKLNPAFWPCNAAPSSYAVIAAQRGGTGNVGALVQGFLRAVWAEDRNIADDAVIRDILSAHGFDPQLADSGLLVGAETYERNLEQAVNDGAFGAPFYVVRETGQRFWGQDRLDFLDRHLASL